MLSIIYITCNRSDELRKSIISCESHISISHEYIIIDNGSKDGTSLMINQLINMGYNIKYFLQKQNLGVSRGRNLGFEKAIGDVCYFIDDDATIVSDGLVLDLAYKYIKKDNNICAMGTDCYDSERKCQLVGIPELNKKMNSECRILSYVGCSHFIKKGIFEYDFLYPDNLIYGAEEAYVSRSIYKNGGDVVQYPFLKVLHVPSSKTRMSIRERKRNGHINTYVIKKYFLPFPYNLLSTFLFFFRVLRFEKFSLKKILIDFNTSFKRYSKKYNNKMSNKQIKSLICKFGFKRIV